MTLTQKCKELEKENLLLRCDNLRMRLDLEVLLDGTESKAAQIILKKYRRKREERNNAFINKLLNNAET